MNKDTLLSTRIEVARNWFQNNAQKAYPAGTYAVPFQYQNTTLYLSVTLTTENRIKGFDLYKEQELINQIF